MCGICGFAGTGDDDATLSRMGRTLIHRGPDGHGQWIGKPAGLAARRLALVDPEHGGQPLFNEVADVAVVFNGEIYNHAALREDLTARGHRFRSHHADGEVIAHLYEQHGPAFPRLLNGQFAIALWDAVRQTLWLWRDHAGVKPLYFSRLPGGGLVFGSEPKALLAHPRISRTPDLAALHHYFSFKNVPAPLSAWAEIRQLRPGEGLRWQAGDVRIDRWAPPPPPEDPRITEAEAAGEIRALLERSVRRQMQADAPVAAMLSGGLDSAGVVALMSRFSARPIDTFTLVYDDDLPGKRADRAFARLMAERLGTHHHEHGVTWRQVEDDLPAVIDAFDEPFSGVTSPFFLNRRIAQSAKAVITGDGADELFGSYRSHRLAQPLALLADMPPDRRDAEFRARAALPGGEDPATLRALLTRGDEAPRRMGLYIADDAAVRALYAPAMQAETRTVSSRDRIAGELGAIASADPLNRMLLLDRRTLLPDQVLAFADRLSMAHGVEARPPFLDPDLMRYADTLPGALKIKGGRTKHILKEALKDLLPEALVNRPKEGFILPVTAWMAGPLRPLVECTLHPDRLARHGLLRAEAVGDLLASHAAGRADHADRLWTLVNFQLWWERHVDPRP
ncbi:MAG: asparagine synthase (glutamine-hydrolyzing) [Rhodospirillaceae bacterium]|nr:asparagine synthase (glutamine-hydrolyzing) [Rhodospirillaceae bacterium]